MFRIKSVRLTNFRSYRGKHTFNLPQAPGLYFLTGSNGLDTALGSNGAGKSTLLEAIYWCLYGKTTRGLRGPDIISWDESSAAVSVFLDVGDSTFEVRRAQAPNSLSITTAGGTLLVEQDELEKRIRLSPEGFKYGVMTPQFNKPFFERTPGEKLEVFSEILNLEHWLEASKRADVAAKKLEAEKNKTAFSIAAAERQHVDLEDEIAGLLERKNVFTEERDAAVAALEAQITTAKAAVRQQKEISHDETELYADKVAAFEKRLDKLSTAIEDNFAKRATINAKLDALTEKMGEIDAKERALASVGAKCPTCLQPVDAKHMRHERNALINKYDLLTDDAASAKTELQALITAGKALAADRAAIKADLQAAEQHRRGAAAAAEQAQQALRAAQQRVIDLQGRADAEAARTNPYAALLAEKRGSFDALKARQAKLTKELSAIEAEHAAVAYWVTGFKKVRLLVIEETLRTLEVEVNNSLTSLGLSDWAITLDVERENKSGAVTKGFHVFVSCPHYDKPVKWESWSGGETQRLQQAGDFGLSNLIMVQAGLQGMVEFYDEPSQHLSDAGLLDLAETLHQRALTQNKVILLIDHHTIDFGEFAGICRVSKDDVGSTFGDWE